MCKTRLPMALVLCFAPVCLAANASPRSADGMGRVTVGGGFRWVPNDYFAQRAQAAGFDLLPKPLLSPQGTASFGYGATELIEVSIDLLAGFERFSLLNKPEAYSSLTYGALIGARLVKVDFLVRGLIPYVGAQFGPMLTTVTTPSDPRPEKVITGYAVNAGVTWLFIDRFGLSLDVRWLWARSYADNISGINVGGLFVSLGVTIVFPSSGNQSFADGRL
jgi:hypothetical protein